LTVTQKTLIVTASSRTKTYGDVVTFAGTEFTTPAGILTNGDAITSVTLTSTGAAATAIVAGSPYPIVASAAVGTGLDNYNLIYVNGILTVNPRELTITASDRTKQYGDVVAFAGTEFTVSAGSLINGNTVTSVTLTSTGAAATASIAGSPYPIVASAAVGTGISNYAISYVDGALTVTSRVLTITASNRAKTYGDVVTFAGTEFTTPAGALLNGDAVTSVTLTSTGAPASATVAGSPYPIVASAAVGTGLGNYTISYADGTLTVVNRILTVGGSFTVNNKVYDGTTSAIISVNNLTLLTVAGIDNVTLTAVATFSDIAVGQGKTVSLTGSTLSGSAASNYTLSLVGAPTTTANISESGVTITGVTAADKLYDGTTSAVLDISGATLTGVLATDDVTLVSSGATGAFVNKNAGTGKVVVTTGFILTGADANKYALIQPTPSADITPIGLTITGVSADNKVYDGTTNAILSTGSGALVGVLPGDAVILNSSGARGYFADKNIGTAKSVSTALFTLDGADAGNYTLTQPDLVANITEASLTITGVLVDDKVYDGTTVATLNTGSAVLTGVFGNDAVNLVSTGVAGSFQDKNAGTDKPVTTSGFDIAGTDAFNYTFLQPSLTGVILPKPATITALDRNKTFGTAVTFAGTEFKVTGLINGDAVTGITISSLGAPASATTGTYPIVAAGASDSNYIFKYVNGVLTVSTADQTITFVAIPEGLRMTQHYELQATSSSGLPVTFEVSDPNIASLNGNILTINQDGDFTITASQEGDENWNPASSVTQSVVAAPTFDNITSLFTPNNDGMNDYWYIPDLLKYGKLQVTVYNRYGQAVYKSDSYKNDWDGTWNGNPLPSATYYYIIKSSERGIIKGVVNIVR
jgi:gliding motility-associated-like protein